MRLANFFTKVCVDPAKLADNIKAMLENFKTNVKANFSSGKNVDKKLNNGLFKLKAAWAIEKKKTRLSEKLTADEIKVVEELFPKCTETECNILGTTLDDMSTHKDCFKGILKLLTKALCVLASDKGKEAAELDANGVIQSIPVQQSEADAVYDVCVNYFIPQCSMVSLFDIYSKLAKNKKPEHSERANKFSETCLKLGDVNSCIEDSTKCTESLKAEFFSAFVSIGKESTPGPESAEVEKIEAVADEAVVETEKEERLRLLGSLNQWRLLESATATCEFTVSSSGWDLTKIESGIDVEEYSGNMIWSLTIVSFLISLFA